MLVEILKPLPHERTTIPTGAVVDATGWRNLRMCQEQGYCREVGSDKDITWPKAKRQSEASSSKVAEHPPRQRRRRTPSLSVGQ